MMHATKEPKVTKKMGELFQRYQIVPRQTNTIITHRVTGQRTNCSPVIFALFELAVKAQFVGADLCPNPEMRDHFRMSIWTLATDNGIELITAKEVSSPAKSDADYWWAVNQIKNAGLYFALLD